MKKLSLILAVILMAALFVVPTSAEDYNILRGTPVIDGVVDAEYYKSSYIAISPELEDSRMDYHLGGDTTEEDSSSGIVYFLWDDNYLYCAAVVQDKHLVNADYDEFKWAEDCVEFYPRYEGIGDGNVHIDAFGKWCVASDDLYTLFDPDNIVYACTQDVANNSYVVEFALPIYDLAEGAEFACCLQLNSITSPTSYIDNEDVACAWGGSRVNNTYYLVSTSASEPATEDTTPADTTPADTTPVDTTPTTDAPATFDAGIVAAVAAIVSAAGYMIAKKK